MGTINRKFRLVVNSVAGKRIKGNGIREAACLECLFTYMVDNIVVNLSTSECVLAQAPYLVADW